MSEKDFVINATARVPDGTAISNKPCYLVTLEEKIGTGKDAKHVLFIAVDLPSLQPAFIQTKGYFTATDKDAILKDHKSVLQGMDKEQMAELILPWHEIKSIRSLVFKAK